MNKKSSGLFALFIATAIYGLYGSFSRLIGLNFGVFSQNLIRNFLVIAISIAIVLLLGSWKTIRRSDRKWLFIWVLSSLSTTFGSFIAFNKLAIGTTYFLFHAGMMLGGYIIGKIVFGEVLNRIKVLSLFLILIGLSIIFSISLTSNLLLWAVIAFISGASTGVWNTMSKKVSQHYSSFQLTILDGLGGLIFSIIAARIFHEQIPKISFSLTWIVLILFALSQLVNIQLIVYGFRKTQAQIGSLIMPLEIVFGALFAYIIFHETISTSTIIGGSLIFLATILPNLYKDKANI